MRTRLPLVLSVAALVIALVGTTGPAVAQNVGQVLFARNADKVDGKHAVGFAATVRGRKGKLVATSPATGLLPNNIVAKAPDADRLDGLDSTAFLRGNGESLVRRGFLGANTSFPLALPDLGTLTVSCAPGASLSTSVVLPNPGETFRFAWVSVDGGPPIGSFAGVNDGVLTAPASPGTGEHQTVYTLFREATAVAPRLTTGATVTVSSSTDGVVCSFVVQMELVRGAE